jgi:LytR cell envelope-related transcriptional attenuator
MALPSAVTLGSVAFVAAAAVGLAVASTSAGEPAAAGPRHGAATTAPDRPAKPAHHADRRQGVAHHARRAKPATAVPKVLVEVYNNTGISGLAARKAAVLQRAGWSVAGTDNWYGDIPADTVYYPPKLKAAAEKLAAAAHVTRLRPAVPSMASDRLTIIYSSAG